jgi:predicted adenine nucleotide alpha hydrolase (AANH) superfamily ATPase
MTQYKDEVEKRKEELKREQLDKDISFIEITYKDSKWHKEITGYKSGRRVAKYNDKRRKDKTEWL